MPLLHFADAGEVFVELLAIAAPRSCWNSLAWSRTVSIMLSPCGEPLDLRCDFARRAVDEQLGEHVRRPIVGRNQHAAAGVRQAAARRRRQHERRKPRVGRTSFSIANWSSEIVFLKLSARGCGAAVR